jgi:hypothetical protein
VLVGIPVITMTTHSPILPFWLAALTTTVTLAGLALALPAASFAAAHPLDAALLGFDGFALTLWITVLPGLQYLSMWIARSNRTYLLMLGALPIVGLVALAILTALRRWLRRPMPSALGLGGAGLTVSYLVLPLAHHTLFSDGHFYITDMNNFFTRDIAVQAFTWIATGTVVWAVSYVRRRWQQRSD